MSTPTSLAIYSHLREAKEQAFGPWIGELDGDSLNIDGEVDLLAIAEIVRQHDEEPGRWWRVLGPEGELWCETSDEAEARGNVRPGDRLERLYVAKHERYVEVTL